MPKLIVDNDEKEEKLSDVFMVTREFQTSAEFSQHIEKRAVQGGNYIDVLVENEMKDGNKLFARNDYMTSVIFEGNKKDIGKILQIKITKSNRNTLFGELINVSNKKVA